jgi:hypothetical protein
VDSPTSTSSRRERTTARLRLRGRRTASKVAAASSSS